MLHGAFPSPSIHVDLGTASFSLMILRCSNVIVLEWYVPDDHGVVFPDWSLKCSSGPSIKGLFSIHLGGSSFELLTSGMEAHFLIGRKLGGFRTPVHLKGSEDLWF